MADSEDVSTLKRRGRRRLVGAIALVLAAVIVLPMIFDSEPRQAPPPVSVRIPSEDDTGFTPKVTPKAAAPDKAAAVPEAKPDAKPEAKAEAKPAPEPKPEAKTEPKPEPRPEPAPETKPVPKAEPKPAARKDVKAAEAKPAAPAAGQFMIPVGAYIDPSGVIAQLKQGKVPYFTEPIATAKGTVIRVRAGPYASQAAADKALAQLQALGLKPGKAVQRN